MTFLYEVYRLIPLPLVITHNKLQQNASKLVEPVQLLPQISGRASRAKLAGIASLRSDVILFIFCTISWFYTAKKDTILTNMDD